LYFAAYSVVRLITGIDIPRTVEIGPGLLIHHFGGITIHPQAKIGSYCEMRQGTTIGLRDESAGPPQIGDHVFIGAYAQILGDISIANHAKIGALALVLKDVPAGKTAVGVPARVLDN
jgi:serine O-acetyltransferase